MNKTLLKEIWGSQAVIMDSELLRREKWNEEYLKSLNSDNLLLNYQLEAGRAPGVSYGVTPKKIHGGWESPMCQLRGHFLGHWLSAAAMRYYETGNREIKAKADTIIEELFLCQQDNGGEWVAPIPEKYLDWIARGKAVWAPQYTVHKIFMGLLDMYIYTDNSQALCIAEKYSEWFLRYSERFTREEFDNILDFETGGMLEIWATLLEITGKEMYRLLLERYYRGRLFDRLLKGEDPLTNMHANTTIPEILGCAKAYEVTGDKKWLDITKAYWKCAVTDRGTFVTGGQTCGEIWTPMKKFGGRLGDKNQEHCTVYNMMRLADFLFRLTREPSYAQYWETNLYNGIMAQAYWKGNDFNGLKSGYPGQGLLTYFLPLKAGARKGWSSETEDFFCCHGTLVQANSAMNRGIYYQEKNQLYVCQYFNSRAEFEIEGTKISITQKEDNLAGSFHLSSTSPERQSISDITSKYQDYPDCLVDYLLVSTSEPVRMGLHIRIPDWTVKEAVITINGEVFSDSLQGGTFAVIDRVWNREDTVCIQLQKGIRAVSLPEDNNIAAFTFGPLVLAGLCEEERTLYVDMAHPEMSLVHDNEREWGMWKNSFKTAGQEEGIRFIPINEVGYEPYTVYFPLKAKQYHKNHL